jgi:replicative DNA helicase
MDTIRVPPHNDEAERSTLGAALIDNRTITEIGQLLEPRHFYREGHRHIWRAMLAVHARGEAVDVITLADELHASAQLEAVGGANVLARLSSEVPSAANAMFYAQLVRKKAALREAIALAHQLTDEAYEDVSDVGAWAQPRLASLQIALEGGARPDAPEVPRAALGRLLKRMEDRFYGIEPDGVPWPLAGLQAKLGHFAPKALTILAARPGVGKSALAVQIAQCAAVAGYPVMLFTLEMDAEEVLERAVSQRSKVSSRDLIRDGQAVGNGEAWPRWIKGVAELGDVPLYVKDDVVRLDQILATASAAIRSQGVKVVIVDYLQIVDHQAGRGNNREQAVAEISRSLKLLAQSTGVHVIALSQLSREVEKRSDKQPKLSDLRESGSIEQDANRVLFLWRESEEDSRHITLTIAKNRGGESNVNQPLTYHGNCYLFTERDN